MPLQQSLLKRLSNEVSGDLIDLTTSTEYSNAYELAIEDALSFLVGDLPEHAFWTFVTFADDTGSGVEMPDKDWVFPIGAIYRYRDEKCFALKGRIDEDHLYRDPEHRYWFYNHEDRKIYVRPCGGKVAFLAVNKEDFGYETVLENAPKNVTYAFLRVLVCKAAEFYLENQITKLFQGLIYEPNEIADLSTGIEIPSISDYPTFNAADQTDWPTVPTLVGDGDDDETIVMPTVTITSHTVDSYTAQFPRDPNDPTKEYPIPDLDPFPNPPPDVEDLMAKAPKFGNPPDPLPDDDDCIYLGELPTRPEEQEFSITYNPEDVPSFPDDSFVEAPTIYSGSKATHTTTVPSRDGVKTVATRTAVTKGTFVDLPEEGSVTFEDRGNSSDNKIAFVGDNVNDSVAPKTSTPIIQDNPDYAKGTDGLSDFMDNDDLEQFKDELNRLDALLRQETAQLNEIGTDMQRYQALTQRLSTLINGAVSNAQTIQNTFGAQLEDHKDDREFFWEKFRGEHEQADKKFAAQLERWKVDFDRTMDLWQTDFESGREKGNQSIESVLRQSQLKIEEQVQKIQSVLSENRTNAEVALTVLRSEIEAYQSNIQAYISETRAWATRVQATFGAYTTEINAWITRIQAVNERYATRVRAIAEANQAKINIYIQVIDSWVRRASIHYQEEGLKLQAWSSELQADISKFNTEAGLFTTLVNERLSRYGADLQNVVAQRQDVLQEFNIEVNKWRSEFEVKFQTYDRGIQVKLQNRNEDMRIRDFKVKQLYFSLQRKRGEYRRVKTSFMVQAKRFAPPIQKAPFSYA